MARITPGILAERPTLAGITVKKRRMQEELAALNARLQAAAAERANAVHGVNRLRGLMDNATQQLAEHRALLPLLPPDPRRNDRIAREASALDHMHRRLPHAHALAAAATVAEEAAALEVDWCQQHILNLHRAHLPLQDAEPVTGRAEDIAVARHYEVSLAPGDGPENRRKLTQRKAAGLLDAWMRAPGVTVLRDGAGRLFIQAPGRPIELRPTTLRVPPTAADVLTAALAAYGRDAYEESEGGRTFLMLPVRAETRRAETYAGPYFTIRAGQNVAQPAHTRTEPWTLTLVDALGAEEVLYAGEPGSSVAVDSAACAQAVAEYAARAAV